MMPGGYPLGKYEHYDRDSCACGCRNKARPGLQPRFFDSACRERWIAKLAIPLTDEDQAELVEPVPAVEPVTTEQVEQIRAGLEESTGRLAFAVETTPPREERQWQQAAALRRLRRWLPRRVDAAVRRTENGEAGSWRRLWAALDDHGD